MRNLKFIISVAILLGGYQVANAQTLSLDTDTIVWEVNQLHDVSVDSTMAYHCKFVTFGSDQVNWIQNEGSYTTEFMAGSTRGSWSNPFVPGTIEYRVRYMDKSGKIVFTRAGDSVTVELFFLEDGKNTMSQVFYVSAITKKL